MPDPLPPDLDRLLIIEKHLRHQQEENATIATYLQVQLDAVRDAIARAQESAPEPDALAERRQWRVRGGTRPQT